MPRFTHLLLVLALVAVIVAGFHGAAPFLSAFILALVLAQVMAPVAGALQRRGWPSGAALGAVLLGTIVIGVAVMVFVGISLAQVAFQLPAYSDRLVALVQDVAPGGLDPAMRSNLVSAMAQVVPVLLAAVAQISGMALLAFLIYAFMLWEAVGLPPRLASAGPMANSVLARATTYNVEVRHFLTITAMLGALTGALMTVFLLIVGLDFALLWGILLFLMSFVPAVGLLIAAVPPIVLAFLQFGPRGGIIVLVGFVIITNVVAQIMKPMYLGKGLNLSRLVVFSSVVIWGMVIGPIGALFAVPLTLLVKTLLDSFDETRWLAIVISGRPAEPRPGPEVATPPLAAEAQV